MMAEIEKCECGSNRPYNQCCKFFVEFFFPKPIKKNDLFVYSWLTSFTQGHTIEFENKFHKHLFRLSHYYDYLEQMINQSEGKYISEINQLIYGIQLNIRHSLLAAIAVSATGLFLQGGMILRSALEDALVLFDIVANNIQIEKLTSNEYSTNSIISRVKKLLPIDITKWYGDLSANYTHYNVLHTTQYLPTRCHADNFASVAAFQNIIRTITTYHIVLEYMYYDSINEKIFWKMENKEKIIDFNQAKIFSWINAYRDELLQEFNPDQREPGFFYSDKSYKLK